MLARISERGQIVIPAALRQRLGLCVGQLVKIVETDGGLLLRPLQETALLAAHGRSHDAHPVAALLEDLRLDG